MINQANKQLVSK